MRARALLVGLVALAACGGSGGKAFTLGAPAAKPAPSTTLDPIKATADQCLFIVGPNDVPDADINCGVHITPIAGGYSVLVLRTVDSTGDVLRYFGKESGCYTDIDVAKMSETRAIDGMISSANGKSSWTYHPDQGLNIVCSA